MSQPLIHITRKHALIFAGFLVLYQFLTYSANDMIMPGMLHVIATFHGNESAVATSLTAYILGGASLQLFLGPLSDSYGRRPVMLFGALLFFVCSVMIACSNSMGYFLWARFFQGMGLCFISVVGYATLQEIFSEMDAVRLTAVMANVAALAPLLGPLAGASFIAYFSWRGIFILIAAVAVIAGIGLWRFMPESVGVVKKDGTSLKRVPLTPRAVMGNYRELLTTPAFMLGSVAMGTITLPCIAWIALSPIMIVKSAHMSLATYALWQLPVFAADMTGNVVLHRLTRSRSLRQILVIGSGLMMCGVLSTWFFTRFISQHFYWLMPGLIVYSFGLGIANAPLARLTLFSTPISKGTASAVMSLVVMVTLGLGVELANSVYKTHINSHFGLYCALSGIIYLLCALGMSALSSEEEPENSQTAAI